MSYAQYAREKFRNIKHSRLPSDYQEVEYIGSTRTQYIDTRCVPTVNSKFVIDCQYNRTDFAQAMGVSTKTGRCFIDLNDGAFGFGFGNYTSREYSLVADLDRHVFFVDLKGRKVGMDDFYLEKDFTFSASNTLYLFARQGWTEGVAEYGGYIAIYNSKIFDNDILLRDYMPCYRKSDGEIGMYDLVNGVFYTNQGTGTFLKGADVN